MALSIGLFALGEVMVNVEEETGHKLFKVPSKLKELFPSKKDFKDSAGAIAQGSVLGFFIGALPGAGSTVASFMSYTVAKRFSRHPEEYGKGAIAGVAAPEAANNSATAGAFVPLLTLGIPGSATTAIMLGALFLYGLQPGPLFFTENPDVVWPIIASMYIGNVILVMLNLPLVPVFASILRIPYYIMYPAIVIISCRRRLQHQQLHVRRRPAGQLQGCLVTSCARSICRPLHWFSPSCSGLSSSKRYEGP